MALSTVAVAQNQYYVSATSGNDGNSGTSLGSAWQHISHAIGSANLTGGATINVASGTYTEAIGCAGNTGVICVNRSGPSSSQRLVLKCSTQWNLSSSTGCLLRNNSGTNGAIVVIGNNVDVVGFDYSNPQGGFGIYADCNGATSGQCSGGNSVHILNNYMHDIGQTVVDIQGGLGCPSAGGILAGPRHQTTAFQTDLQVIGNRVSNFGLQSKAQRNGGSCNFTHGLYLSPNSPFVVYDNIIVEAVTFGIQIYSYPCNLVVSNNTIDHSGKGDLVLGGGDCSPQGTISVLNNYFGDAPAGAVTLGAGGTAPCDSTHRIKIANSMTPSGTAITTGNRNGCTDVSGTVTESATTTFVSYSAGSTNNDYHLKTGSAAIGGGTPPPGCVSGSSISPCVPGTDFAGTAMSNPPPIGAYTSGGGGGTAVASLSPTALSFAPLTPLQGCTAAQTSNFSNIGTGNATLTITAETLSAQSDFQFGGSGSCSVGTVLASQQSCTVSAKFCPSKVGVGLSANIVVVSTAPNSPQTVTMTGDGVNPPPPSGLTISVQ